MKRSNISLEEIYLGQIVAKLHQIGVTMAQAKAKAALAV
jgi:lambda repressor-like predicted transcriptional regulator